MRRAVIDRRTTETQILLKLTIEGKGRYEISTGIRFLDHMLELFTRHGAFDLTVKATGDLDVDQHHTVEDLGIALGEAVSAALGNRRGINRAGYFVMPMDETLAVVALDLGGRPHASVDLKLKVARVGDLQAELIHDFFEGFAIGARANVHAKVLYGRSSHHHVEAVFKAFARALARRVLEGQAAGESAAEYQGTDLGQRTSYDMTIALVDYGAGNLTSVKKAFLHLGADARCAGDARRSRPRCRGRRPWRRPLLGDADATPEWHAAIRAQSGRRPSAAWHLRRHAVAVSGQH